MKNKGFTLVEMLSVIIILSAIMVISIPSYIDVAAKMKESSKNQQIKVLTDAVIEYSYKYAIDAIKEENKGTKILYYPIDCIFAKEIFLLNKANLSNKTKTEVYIDPTTNKELVGFIEIKYDMNSLTLQGEYKTTTTAGATMAQICAS